VVGYALRFVLVGARTKSYLKIRHVFTIFASPGKLHNSGQSSLRR
jgi:hypothetical protein